MPLRFALAPPLLIAATAIACGGSSDTDIHALATEAADVQPATRHTIVADDLEFDTATIVVPAGAEVVLELDNQDAGVLHNIAAYTDESALDDHFKGELFAGVETQEYTFTAPQAGVYFFRCDAHPEMNGAFIAK